MPRDHVANASADGVARRWVRVPEHDFNPGPRRAQATKPLPPPCEDGPGGGKRRAASRMKALRDETRRGVFDGEVDVVAGLGIRHRGDGAAVQTPSGEKIEIGRDFGQWAIRQFTRMIGSGASGKKKRPDGLRRPAVNRGTGSVLLTATEMLALTFVRQARRPSGCRFRRTLLMVTLPFHIQCSDGQVPPTRPPRWRPESSKKA